MNDSIHDFADEAVRRAEAKHEQDERTTVWVFVWTLFIFKCVTIGAILWASGWGAEAQLLMWATSWIWIGFPLFALTPPTILFIRRWRVRRKRAALRKAEWMLEEATSDHAEDLRASASTQRMHTGI
jgi:hypothetical protein